QDLDQDARVGAHPRSAGRRRLQYFRGRATARPASSHAGAQAGEAADQVMRLLHVDDLKGVLAKADRSHASGIDREDAHLRKLDGRKPIRPRPPSTATVAHAAPEQRLAYRATAPARHAP